VTTKQKIELFHYGKWHSFLLSYTSGIHPAIYPLDIGVALPPSRRTVRKAVYFSPLLPRSAKFKNTHSYNFTPPSRRQAELESQEKPAYVYQRAVQAHPVYEPKN